MTAGLLLDTHIALWLESGHERLKPATLGLIESCWRDGGIIYLSAIVVWEIAVLVNAGRLRFHIPIQEWVDTFLARPGVEPAPLGHHAAARSYQFRELEHRDPADHLLIASAVELGCPLVTYDDRIRRFGERYGERYGFFVAA